jgi:transketolase
MRSWKLHMLAKPRAMRDALLDKIHNAMASDESIFFVSADFGSPALDRIRSEHPKHFVNVGIAEQNLINVSAGLALEGYKVFAYAIAPFITMRCFEQIRVSLALLSESRPMNVNLIGVGAGYSYVVSGPTHQCYEDITLMRAMPNFQVMSPADHVTAESLFPRCIDELGPKYLRLDAQILPVIYSGISPDMVNGFNVHLRGEFICLVATGYMLHTAFTVADRLLARGVKVGVIDLFDLARFSSENLCEALRAYEAVVSMEEAFAGRGGLDALLYNFLGHNEIKAQLLNIGVDGGYRFELGTRAELHEQVGIGPDVVTRRILDLSARIEKRAGTINGGMS